MTELPTGTLTLLFSDIEGSTVLLHRLGSRWGEALSDQRRILRAAFGAHGGIEMGTEGDSFFVVFGSARAALAAAVRGQRELQAHHWPEEADVLVRMGIHTGEPQRHEDGYVGEDVHRAARIGASANGAQIVLSDATRRLVEQEGDVAFRDLGRHRLKDLPGDELLFDVVAPGLRSDFPALRSLGKPAALPTFATPLVGRDVELASVGHLFLEQQAQLVTITGPGGTGKTRLATAVASALEPHYPDGVYFVGLHTAADPERMWSVIDDALDPGGPPGSSAAERVTSHLSRRRALLILDNLEQIDGADAVTAAILAAAPDVHLLASSRRPLMLVGEHEYPVPPLALPTSSDVGSVLSSAAVEMFVQRARMVRPSFRLTDGNRDDVVTLCRALDGLPLALELAASHTRLLSPHALLARIDGRLGLGVTAADRPERQRSLGATIAWSYDLLDGAEQSVFRGLGVFRSPCDLDAVSAVAGGQDIDGTDADVLDIASRLVGTSLVRVDEGTDGEPRLALLETIRMFALERLGEAGEVDAVRLRHLRWCASVAERTAALLRGPLHTTARDAITAIDDDIRAALDWSLRPAGSDGRERVAAGHALLAVATEFWYRFGNVTDARQWQERGVAVADDEDTAENVTLLHSLGVSLLQQGEVDPAVALFDRSLAMAGRLGHREYEARAYNDLGIARRQAGRYADALELLTRSLVISRAVGSATRLGTTLSNLVVVNIDLERYGDAVAAATEAMSVNAANGDDWSVAIDRLNYIAAVLRFEGPQSARTSYAEWAESIASFEDRELSIDLMEIGAGIAAGLDEPALSARLLGGADTQRALIAMPRSAAETEVMQSYVDSARAASTDAEWRANYSAGAELTPADAIRLVNALGVELDVS